MSPSSAGLPSWRDAWEAAHYGPSGFYRVHADPSAHFRTSVMESATTAQNIFAIVFEQWQRIGSPNQFTVLDAGSGSGELTRDLTALCSAESLSWQIRSVNFLDGDIRSIAPIGGNGGVIAHELLDDIPCQIAELDESRTARIVLVDPTTGVEIIGEPVTDAEQEWIQRWWPPTAIAARREIGLPRDHLWAQLLTVFDAGCAIMIDYCTTQPDRVRGVFDAGTLAGYRHGRITRPIPDSSMNITAHVCLESLIAVGDQLGKPAGEVTRPDAHSDFHWLVQPL